MCFSAAASFTASAVLGGTGSITIKSTPDKRWRWYAAIPLLFAVQQALEGVQWLLPKPSTASLAIGYGYLLFAFLLWPSYVPFAVLQIEPDPRHQKLIRRCWYAGVVVSTYLLGCLLFYPLQINQLMHSISYDVAIPSSNGLGVLYVLAACGSCLLSSRPWIQWFGLAGLLSATVSLWIWQTTFTSVWCFFAAVLSILVYGAVLNARKSNRRTMSKSI